MKPTVTLHRPPPVVPPPTTATLELDAETLKVIATVVGNTNVERWNEAVKSRSYFQDRAQGDPLTLDPQTNPHRIVNDLYLAIAAALEGER